ncbi:MAG: efflux RND transporter periplasmic adaptor subunit [Thiobacillus sp.]
MNTFTPHTLSRLLMAATMLTAAPLAHAGQPLVCLIQPSRIAEVGSSVTGVLDDIRVERGDIVKKGQVIAVLRNDVERAALNVAQSRAQAEAEVQAAMAALEFAHQSTVRAEDLVKKKFVSEQALDKARTEERVAVQKLAQTREQRQVWAREQSLAKSQLAQRTITSPISGIVAERYLSTGERVEDRSIARVVSINPLHVEVMVPASSFGKIKTGMIASVMPELPDAAAVEARVNLVDKLIDGASNTFRVRLELPNPGNAIPAGPRCKVDFGEQVIGSTKSASTASPPPAFSRVSMVTPAPAKASPSKAAPSRPSAPATASASTLETSALSALEQWRKAWESKDMAAYLAAYAADFRGDNASRKAWARQREARIVKPGSLSIRISNARVQPVADNKVRVHFRQQYQAAGYRDTTLKSLLMVLDKGTWRILEERARP